MLIEKIKNHSLLRQLRDVRSLGLIVFAGIVLLVSFSGVRAIQTNYQLEKQIAELRQQNDVESLQNQNQKLRNDYYKTPQYLELAARQNFGLAMPGETVLLVPKSVALAQVQGVTVPSEAAPSATVAADTTKQSLPVRNIKAWFNFFLNRKTTD